MCIRDRVENWAYLEKNTDKPVDIFFVCPTVYGGGEGVFNMDMEDEETKASFLGATNMEKGIYDESGRFFAPYYRQAGLNVYALPEEEREVYLALAYEDVRAAFSYYLEHYNDSRPIVLAGFSQGADMCIRLLKDFFADEEVDVYKRQVKLKGKTELAELAQSFDQMRQAIAARMERESEAVRANQELIGALSHDLRTPLTKQSSYLELALRCV